MAQQATGLVSQNREGGRSAVEGIAVIAATTRPEQLRPTSGSRDTMNVDLSVIRE